jgi:hypothetical protein
MVGLAMTYDTEGLTISQKEDGEGEVSVRVPWDQVPVLRSWLDEALEYHRGLKEMEKAHRPA